jgi:hypothetical protein
LLKRLAAPVWVFNLGIFFSMFSFVRLSRVTPPICPWDRTSPELFRLQLVYSRPGYPASKTAQAILKVDETLRAA